MGPGDTATLLAGEDALIRRRLRAGRSSESLLDAPCDPEARRGLWVLRDEASGVPAGGIEFRRLPGSGVAILSAVWLLPAYRGRGLAAAAASEAAGRLLDAGASAVEMHVAADNAASLATAARAGFREVPERSGPGLKVMARYAR